MGIPSAARKTINLADGRSVEGIAVSTGNPHFVIVVDNAEFSVAGSPWQEIGAANLHPLRFSAPDQRGVRRASGAPQRFEIRIFERGVGPTTSSGTGTSASATAAIAFHGCTSPLRVVAPGGAQTVSWNGPGTELELTGPATLDCARRSVVRMTARSKPLLPLRPIAAGTGVSVVSPASFAIPDRVDQGVERLRRLGYQPHLGANTQIRGPLFFAGSPQQRLEDLHAAFADPETSLSRGGARRLRFQLLARWQLISRLSSSHPKPFFAYSDMTGLQLRLLDQLGLPAFHGPMVAADFYLEDGVHLESLQSCPRGPTLLSGRA